MNIKKIAVLRKAIQMLENGFDYNWNRGESCNNGVVAVASYGDFLPVKTCFANYSNSMGAAGFYGRHEATYTKIINRLGGCPITGLPLGLIQQALKENDFTKTDIQNLEYLKDENVLKILGVKELQYDVKENLLRYLRAWAELLTEEDQKEIRAQSDKEFEKLNDIYKPKTEYKVVRVSESIFKEAKELIMQ